MFTHTWVAGGASGGPTSPPPALFHSSTPFFPSLPLGRGGSHWLPTPQRLPLLASDELRTARRRDIWPDPRPPVQMSMNRHIVLILFLHFLSLACASRQEIKKKTLWKICFLCPPQFPLFLPLERLCPRCNFNYSSLFLRGAKRSKSDPRPPHPTPVCININQLGLWYVKTAQTEVM